MAPDDAMQVAGLTVESGDTPAKPEDYLFVNGHRLVSAVPAAGTSDQQPASAGCGQPLPPPGSGSPSLAASPLPALPGAPQVKPYHFDYGCNMKQRWIGKNIIDIFTKASGRCGSRQAAGGSVAGVRPTG